MRDRNGKYTNQGKERAKARLYWLKGFSQGYGYSAERWLSFASASSQGRFAQPYAYGLQRGMRAGAVAVGYGIYLGEVA